MFLSSPLANIHPPSEPWPPIFPGRPTAAAVESFRQARESRIIVSAHRVDRGVVPDLEPPSGDSDFYFVEAVDPEDAAAKVVKVVAARIPARFGLDPHP